MDRGFIIGNKLVGKDSEPFIIAEAGINHNGDMDLAKKMILAAKEAGADAVKFQTFHAEEFIQDNTTLYTYKSQGKEITEPMLKMFKRYELSILEWREIKDFCDGAEIAFLSTPQNISDLELLMDIGMDAIKVGSDDFINLPLIQRYAEEKLPLILSCGMATEEEIEQTIQCVKGAGKDIPVCILQCTSEYPTPPEDVNILKLMSLGNKYPDILFGFSDHTQGVAAAVMAIVLGARVFEKHFTLSHNLEGPDHWFSEEPDGLQKWVGSIREAYKMLGSGKIQPTRHEKEMRKLAHRSITVLKTVHAGELLDGTNLGLRRPGTGIKPSEWSQIIGKAALHDISGGSQLKWEDIKVAKQE